MGTRVPTIYVLSKNKKKFSTEIFHFSHLQKSLYIACIMHGRVFIMFNYSKVAFVL